MNQKQFKGNNLLVDTNILIYQLNGKIDISEELASAQSLFVSAITVAELFAGVEKHNFLDLKDYLDTFTVMPVSEEISTLAGAYKSTFKTMGLKDLIIAATAQLHHLTLVTANEKDFKGITTFKNIFVKLD